MQSQFSATATLACLVLATVVTSYPSSDFFVPEGSTFLQQEADMAQEQLMQLYKSGKTKDDCKSLSAAGIKSIEDALKSSQKALDALPTGAKCASLDLEVTGKAEKELQNAVDKEKAAAKAYEAARTYPVQFRDMSIEEIQYDDDQGDNNCDKFKECFFGEKAFLDAVHARDEAEKAHSKAKGELMLAQTAFKDAKATADADHIKCACDAQTRMAKSWPAAEKEYKDSETEWKKSHLMLCALEGTPMSSCKVPARPTVTKPTLKGRAVSEKCPTYAPNVYVKNAKKGGWGGSCTCPDGSVYQVGDNMNSCGSLACFGGGKPGKCNRYDGKWSKAKVTCGAKKP